ncbi:MAG: HAD family hydrolase [Bacteroidota bacterium]
MDKSHLDIDKIKAILFDLDGTLYDLEKMQKIMRKKILAHLLTNPWKLKEILIVYYFRKDRKKAAGAFVPDLAITQYRWIQRRFDIPIEEVKAVIDKWMFSLPLNYLEDLAFSALYPFIKLLKEKEIPFGVHSDLPIGKKLEVLKIRPNLQSDSTDEDINVLKPHPAGIMAFAKKLGIREEEVLVLGDKLELDGRMAKEGGAQFFHIQSHIAEKQYEILFSLFENDPDPKK